MTLPLHCGMDLDAFVQIHTAHSCPVASPKPRARPRPPLSTTAKAAKAATRMVRAVDRVEDTLPWRDSDIVRGLRAALALSQAYADVLYERRVEELGTLPGGLRIVRCFSGDDFFGVEDDAGHIQLEVHCSTPAAQIRQLADAYVTGVRRGEADVYRRQNAKA